MPKNFKKSAAEMFITTAEPEPEARVNPEDIQLPEGYRIVKEPKTARFQMLIRPALKEALIRAAEEKGISANELLNIALEEYLREHT